MIVAARAVDEIVGDIITRPELSRRWELMPVASRKTVIKAWIVLAQEEIIAVYGRGSPS